MSRSNGAPRKHPTAWLYLLAILLPIGGCAGTIGLVAKGLDSLTDKVAALPRAATPGAATVELPAGTHEIFYETRAGAGDTSYATTTEKVAAPVDCTLAAPGGADVPLATPSGQTHYSFKGRAGESIYRVEIAKAGKYELACADAAVRTGAAAPAAGDQIVFVAGNLLAEVVKPFVPMGVGFVAGVTLFLAVFFMRRRSVA
jgi:hypothetical protein